MRGDPPEQLSQLRARVGEGVWERMLDESGASEAEVGVGGRGRGLGVGVEG